MAIEYDKKDDIIEEILEQDIMLHCTRATCMESTIITKQEYKRMVEEDRGNICPKCGARVI